MAAKPKMLIVGARGISGNEGGVEKFAEEFVKRAAKHLDLTVTCLDSRETAHEQQVKLVQCQPSMFCKTDKAMYYLTAAKICLTQRFDYIFLLGINSSILGAIVKLLPFSRPYVLARSGSIDYKLAKWGWLGKLYFRLSEQALRAADLVIAVSPSIQKHLSAKGLRSKVIGNGVELGAAWAGTGRRASPPVVIAVGRLTAQKNYEVLLKAARQLGDGVRVRIIGGPDPTDEHARLRGMIAAGGIANVELTGALRREDVFRAMEEASVFVNCSVHEGMSNSVLEAIQHCLPLVLSDIDANRDLQLAEHIYVPADDAGALARTIAAACRNPEAFIAPREKFPGWDEIVARILTEIGVPPRPTRLGVPAGVSTAPGMQQAAAFKD